MELLPAGDRGTEHHLTTTRTARYYTAGATPAHAKRVWLVLHGYGQLAGRFIRHFDGIVPSDTMIVAPEALSRFYLEAPRADGGHLQRAGAAWLTREDREAEIADARAWLDTVCRTVTDNVMNAGGIEPQVSVLAFSQGVATAMRWIASGLVMPERLIFWAGSLAQDVDAHGFQRQVKNSDVVLVAGTHDNFATPAARSKIVETLSTLHVNARQLTFDGGHEMNAPLLADLLVFGAA